MQKAAVLGSRGQLGIELTQQFSSRGYEVASFERAGVDITDAAGVDSAIGRYRPDVVINAAAYNQVDVAETEPLAAFQVNALAVRNIAIACRNAGAALVHFSTDYVFDGMTGQPYREEDPVGPLSAYAVSKLAGEHYARAYTDRALIIRTSGVYGPGGLRTARGNFVELMLRLAANGGPIRVVEDHVASPTYAPALAARTVDLVEKQVFGILHAGGGAPISWHDWAAKIFAVAELQPRLQATNEREFRTAARRPKYSALSNAKMESLGVAPMPSLDTAIADYLQARLKTMASRAG